MELKTKINTEKGKQVVEITRDFDLPIELLYRAYTEAELIEQWMGTKVKKLDCRSHGGYEFETTHNNQVVFSANGVFHQVTLNEKIVRTFEMENMPIGVQLEFLEFQRINSNSSRIMITIIYKSEKHRAEQLKLPFASGLSMAHDRLQEILSKTH